MLRLILESRRKKKKIIIIITQRKKENLKSHIRVLHDLCLSNRISSLTTLQLVLLTSQNTTGRGGVWRAVVGTTGGAAVAATLA